MRSRKFTLRCTKSTRTNYRIIYYMKTKFLLSEYGLYLSWAIALVSMVASLYFSEVVGIVPCILCWLQRIAMYPLVAIIAVGIIRRDKVVSLYVLPLSIIGAIIAFYQNLLIWGVVSETLAPCSFGVSCVTQSFVVLNFITIPLLSLVSFLIITILMAVHWKYNNE